MKSGQSADFLIIGGGVMGVSVAYHLASMGASNIVVLERGSKPGEGSTGKATGGFRAQFATEVNVKLSLLSREKLLHFQEETGVDPGYRPYGYLFLAPTQTELAKLMQARRTQKAAGLNEVELIDDEEIGRLNPAVDHANLVGGSFCSTDGFIVPMEILRGYQEAASRLGVRFEYGTDVNGLQLQQNRVVSVQSSRENFQCGALINAAGAWAGQVGNLAYLEIPVRPLKRQVAVVAQRDILPENMPMTIFTEDGFHLRVRDRRVLLLLPDQPRVDDAFDTSVSDEWLAAVSLRARKTIPVLAHHSIDRDASYAGLYEMSPDKHAILGKMPACENLFLINGSSGHGVMHSPALGQLLAEIILHGKTRSMDVHALRPARFMENDLNPVSDIL